MTRFDASGLEAIIFDVEGTLIDCVGPTLASWRKVLGEAGHRVPLSRLQECSGMDGAMMLEKLLPALSPHDRKALVRRQGDVYRRAYMPKAKPFPDAAAVVSSLHAAGFRLALATTAQEDELEHYEKLLGIGSVVDAVVCGSEVSTGKPDPALIRKAQSRLGPRRAVLVVGDTPYDAEAAAAVGLPAAGVLTGGFTHRELVAAGCVFTVRHLRDLAERLLGVTAHASARPR